MLDNPAWWALNTLHKDFARGTDHAKRYRKGFLPFIGFSELSAICTDPAYTGRGYAQQLIAHICHKQIASNITLILHVALTNQRAIKLYEHMGFHHRREISFWRCKKH